MMWPPFGRRGRFFFNLAYKFDLAIYMVPKHVFSTAEDWTKFTHFDMAKGWPITTGPWQVVFTSPTRSCSTGVRSGGRPRKV